MRWILKDKADFKKTEELSKSLVLIPLWVAFWFREA